MMKSKGGGERGTGSKGRIYGHRQKTHRTMSIKTKIHGNKWVT